MGKLGRIKTRVFMFEFAWTLFASTIILNAAIFYVNNDMLDLAFSWIRYIAYLVCLVKFFTGKFHEKYIPFLLVLATAFAISGLGSGNLTYPLYGIVLLGSIGVDTRITVKTTMWLQGFYLTIIVLLSQIGVIQDYVFDPLTRSRHGLGFSWTTTGPMLFFYFCLCLIYIRQEKLKLSTYLILETINIWLFYMTDSKMAFALLSLVLIFFAFQKKNRRRWSKLSKLNGLYVCMPFLMCAFTLLIVKIYNWYNPVWRAADRFLSYRLGLMQNAYLNCGIHPLGQSIHWVGYDYKSILSAVQEPYNYVDNSYLQIALNNGLLFLFSVLCLYAYGIYKAEKKNDYYLVFVYLIILLLSLTEPRLMNFAYNPFPLIALGAITESAQSMKKRNRRKSVSLSCYTSEG